MYVYVCGQRALVWSSMRWEAWHLPHCTRLLLEHSPEQVRARCHHPEWLTPPAMMVSTAQTDNRIQARQGHAYKQCINVTLLSPLAPSCSPGGVSCRGSGRGGMRVWWGPPPGSCGQAPVAGYTITATPTTQTNHQRGEGEILSLCSRLIHILMGPLFNFKFLYRKQNSSDIKQYNCHSELAHNTLTE